MDRLTFLEDAVRNFVESKSGFGHTQKKVRTIERVFNEFDRDGTGQIDEEEFLAALVRMNIVGLTDAALELFDKFDEDMSGALSYKEFARALFPSQDCESKMCGDFPRASWNQADGVIAKVRTRILELAGKNAGIRSVTRILRSMDKDGSKTLRADELQEGLAGYGVVVSDTEVSKLMAHFDRDKSSTISIEEFLRGLRGRMSRRRRKLTRQAWDQLVKHLKLDGPEDSVTLAELATFYDVRKKPSVIDGLQTPIEAMREFVRSWDQNGDDKVDWKEFFEYYKDLSAGIESDDFFELMMRNAWHLSGGSGSFENTSNIRAKVTFYTGEEKIVEIVNDFGISRSSLTSNELLKLLVQQGFDKSSISEVGLFS